MRIFWETHYRGVGCWPGLNLSQTQHNSLHFQWCRSLIRALGARLAGSSSNCLHPETLAWKCDAYYSTHAALCLGRSVVFQVPQLFGFHQCFQITGLYFAIFIVNLFCMQFVWLQPHSVWGFLTCPVGCMLKFECVRSLRSVDLSSLRTTGSFRKKVPW